MSEFTPTALEFIRTELIKKHGINISPDDPILMTVTINHFLIDDFKALLEVHNKTLTNVLAENIDHALSGLDANISSFENKYSNLSSIEVLDILKNHKDEMLSFRQDIVKMHSNLIFFSCLFLGISALLVMIPLATLIFKAS